MYNVHVFVLLQVRKSMARIKVVLCERVSDLHLIDYHNNLTPISHLYLECIMRKNERGEERDMTTHLIKIQVFTYVSRVIFSLHKVCTTYSTDGSSLVPSSCLIFQRSLETPLGLGSHSVGCSQPESPPF